MNQDEQAYVALLKLQIGDRVRATHILTGNHYVDKSDAPHADKLINEGKSDDAVRMLKYILWAHENTTKVSASSTEANSPEIPDSSPDPDAPAKCKYRTGEYLTEVVSRAAQVSREQAMEWLRQNMISVNGYVYTTDPMLSSAYNHMVFTADPMGSVYLEYIDEPLDNPKEDVIHS